MKKIITLALSFLTVALMANPVDKKVAERVAFNHYSHYAPSNISDFSIEGEFETNYNGLVTFYTFNFKSGGFVIVAADDASIPVLAYSFEGTVDQNTVNPAAKSWLENYSKAISELNTTKMSNQETRPQWDQILQKQMNRSILDVAPLVATNWDQGCYYNAQCPAASGAPCGRVWTGCVATTMSVLMKYNEWPVNGVGYHTYTHPLYGVQTANFANTTYNYAAMPNSVTTANASVATLMYHAGVSVNMQYGVDGSGAYSEDVPFALINYFNYDAACHLEAKIDYPVIDDWYALLRADLDASQPVYYAGSSTASGGHAWILDGYRLSDNKFHFNWGWSGSYNGYFAIGALNPGGSNFNDENRVIVGIVPGNNPTAWIVQNSHFTAPSRGINYMHAVNETVAWASAYDGAGTGATINEFAKTINGGETWTTGQVLGGTTYGIGNICALNGNIAYVALYNGVAAQNSTCGIYKTTNGGLTWAQLPGALQGSLSFANNVYFWNEQEGMCHGDVKDGYFEIFTTVNGGTTWQRVPQANITGGTPASGEGGWTSVIETAGENSIMFGTNKGKVYISDDRGFNWRVTNSNITPGTNGGINLIAFTDPQNGIVAQTVAPISYRRTSDGGLTWETFTPTGSYMTNDMTAIPGSNGIYVSTGASGTIGAAYSTDAGSTWTTFPGTSAKQFLATDFYNNSVGYAGGFNEDQNNGGIFRMLGTLGVSPGPQIVADPAAITSTLAPGLTENIPFFLINNGDADLEWSITLDGTPGWLSLNTTSGTTPAAGTTEITVTIDATGLSSGSYSSALLIANNSINNTLLEVPVTLNVQSTLDPPTDLAAAVTGNNVHLTWNAPGGSTGEFFFDDFESYENFTLDFSPWTTNDVDGANTYVIDGYIWPNGGDPQSFIIFNSLATDPAMSENVAFSGEKTASCFNSVPPPFNNDWLISPKRLINSGDIASFMALSYTDQYGLERFTVSVSTTTTDPSAFTVISEGAYVTAPADAYGEFTYDLSDYAGQEVYVAINCLSQDAFFFLVDDFFIGAPGKKPISIHNPAIAGNLSKTVTGANTPMPNTIRGGERELLGYNVYRNGNQINSSMVTTTSYDDNGLAAGTYEYHVRAVYTEGESANSNAAVAVISSGNTLILDFEPYADFTLDVTPWTNLDVDGSDTYGIDGITFPHAGEPLGYIVFNPLTTTPAVTGMEAHGGARLGASFASITPPNNDFLISPKLLMGDDAKINMWVKSYTDQYGLEEYKIVVSTTDLNPASFVTVAGPIQAPADAWTNVEYDLSEYSGQEVYVGIQCVSNDRFIFMVDDIAITFSTGINNPDIAKHFSIYPNPATNFLNIKGDIDIINLNLVNTSGKIVLESMVNDNEYSVNISEVPAGLYMLRLTTKVGVVTSKISIK